VAASARMHAKTHLKVGHLIERAGCIHIGLLSFLNTIRGARLVARLEVGVEIICDWRSNTLR
jgi:hypothetical protein